MELTEHAEQKEVKYVLKVLQEKLDRLNEDPATYEIRYNQTRLGLLKQLEELIDESKGLSPSGYSGGNGEIKNRWNVLGHHLNSVPRAKGKIIHALRVFTK